MTCYSNVFVLLLFISVYVYNSRTFDALKILLDIIFYDNNLLLSFNFGNMYLQ